MKDNIVVWTCIQILIIWLIDYFDGHSFGIEASLATINALVMIWVHTNYGGKDK